jgi:hypothetical protein
MRYLVLIGFLFYSLCVGADVPKYTVLPNPASTQFSITFDQVDLSFVSVEIYSVLGSKMNPLSIRQNSGMNSITVNVADLPDGIYLLRITHKDSQSTKRIKVQH